jgi:hypothetical protein
VSILAVPQHVGMPDVQLPVEGIGLDVSTASVSRETRTLRPAAG